MNFGWVQCSNLNISWHFDLDKFKSLKEIELIKNELESLNVVMIIHFDDTHKYTYTVFIGSAWCIIKFSNEMQRIIICSWIESKNSLCTHLTFTNIKSFLLLTDSSKCEYYQSNGTKLNTKKKKFFSHLTNFVY